MPGTALTKVPFTEKIELYCWDKRRSAQAAELSPDSVTLSSLEPLAEGSLVTLRIKIPGSLAFTVLGRVVSNEQSGQAPGRVHIDFIDVPPADRARIVAFAGADRPLVQG